jgi:hypothetical protein
MATVEIAFVAVFAHDGGEKGYDLYRFTKAHVITEETSETFET